jgi:opacity protein-like surface antigen
MCPPKWYKINSTFDVSVETLVPDFPTIRLLGSGIGGEEFDDDSTIWAGFVGYDLNDFFGLELSYARLGEFSREDDVFNRNPPRLEISELSLSGRFSWLISRRFSVSGSLGISRNFFSVKGDVSKIFAFPSFGQNALGPARDPDDETGHLWGVGLEWRFTDRIIGGVEAIRHDTQVLETDTFSLRIRYKL